MITENQLSRQQHRKRKTILIILFLFLSLVVLGVLSVCLFKSGDSSLETTIQEKAILESVDEHSHP